jgi:hypothetical protein
MRPRLLTSVCAALALVLAFGGCVVFKVEPKAKQVGPDTVRVKLKICASGVDTGTCPDLGNADSDANDDETQVVLLGMRVPEGSDLPRDVVGNQLELRKSKQFGRVLNNEAPTPIGVEWFGYRSAPVVASREDTAEIKIEIGLPDGYHKRRFKYRPTVGYFTPDDEHPTDSPIACGDGLFYSENDDDGARTCIDSPTPDETAEHLVLTLD